MNTEKPTTVETAKAKPDCAPSGLLGVALPILQGLLASGHYTIPGNDEDAVKIERVDNGPDWKGDDGNPTFARRKSAIAIEDALSLAKELLDQIRLDERIDT